MRPEGGELVVLFSLFGGQGHIIVNAESSVGGFETRMHSFPAPTCNISRVRVTGLDGSEVPSDSHVAISEEIVKALKEAHGEDSVNAASA
ncbi:uncharacterized protein EMH_0008670 [Eimeria mitis]|uniref:Uncharacterized protein n=1 Tax=Eimeria mitis TaxID=44415 RepID=U6K2U3_9EIME|nr:uncharacterized protein EMH_0008670 [Eimeria mitis]CDJ31301.1 hypothetical protein, conserved [Eimeria mitis]